jgi:hypothetical protein
MRAADIVGCHWRERSFAITQQDPKVDARHRRRSPRRTRPGVIHH